MRLLISLLICGFVLSAQTGASTPAGQVSFLFGEWTSKGPTQLGDAEGSSTFTPELENQVVVRRSWVKYTSGKAAGTRHDDLLIIYAEAPDTRLRAIFFDGEGHIIRYLVTVASPGKAVFESDGAEAGPRYRLTHAVTGKTMETRFEMAMPGQSGYRTYVSGTSTKK